MVESNISNEKILRQDALGAFVLFVACVCRKLLIFLFYTVLEMKFIYKQLLTLTNSCAYQIIYRN